MVKILENLAWGSRYADLTATDTHKAGILPSNEKHFMEKKCPYVGLQKAALVLVFLCTTGNSQKTIYPLLLSTSLASRQQPLKRRHLCKNYDP